MQKATIENMKPVNHLEHLFEDDVVRTGITSRGSFPTGRAFVTW